MDLLRKLDMPLEDLCHEDKQAQPRKERGRRGDRSRSARRPRSDRGPCPPGPPGPGPFGPGPMGPMPHFRPGFYPGGPPWGGMAPPGGMPPPGFRGPPMGPHPMYGPRGGHPMHGPPPGHPMHGPPPGHPMHGPPPGHPMHGPPAGHPMHGPPPGFPGHPYRGPHPHLGGPHRPPHGMAMHGPPPLHEHAYHRGESRRDRRRDSPRRDRSRGRSDGHRSRENPPLHARDGPPGYSMHAPTMTVGFQVRLQNCPPELTAKDLAEAFGEVSANRVEAVDLLRDSHGRATGEAVVVFNTAADAQNAVRRYHDGDLNGRKLKVIFEGEVTRGR